jgi:hypothetical protein
MGRAGEINSLSSSGYTNFANDSTPQAGRNRNLYRPQ